MFKKRLKEGTVLIKACANCKYYCIGGTMEWSDYCKKQGGAWIDSNNVIMELNCPLYKQSFLAKLCGVRKYTKPLVGGCKN